MLQLLGTSPTRCLSGEHQLVCSCGDPLERLPQGDEWYYRSTVTGNTQEATLPEPLQRLGWEGLAQQDIGLYSMLTAREALGMLYHRHNHRPVPCGEHEHPVEVPECCDWPMRLTPQGWVCRQGCDR